MSEYEAGIKIILPAGKIQNEQTVTKLTGTKQYTVERIIRIHTAGALEKRHEFHAVDDVFLLDGSGNINAISAETEVVVLIHDNDIVEDLLLNGIII